jgi:dephospho-CoA kinase
MQRLFDLTVLVLIEPEEQIRRLIQRNKISEEEAKKRLDSQMPIGEKMALADIIIDNRGSIWETEQKTDKLWQTLKKRERKTHNVFKFMTEE